MGVQRSEIHSHFYLTSEEIDMIVSIVESCLKSFGAEISEPEILAPNM